MVIFNSYVKLPEGNNYSQPSTGPTGLRILDIVIVGKIFFEKNQLQYATMSVV